MAYTITAACTACGACLPACPIDAIQASDPIYVIDASLCVDFEDCLPTCPVDAIVRVEEGQPALAGLAAATIKPLGGLP
jgi:ferredoxin